MKADKKQSNDKEKPKTNEKKLSTEKKTQDPSQQMVNNTGADAAGGMGDADAASG